MARDGERAPVVIGGACSKVGGKFKFPKLGGAGACLEFYGMLEKCCKVPFQIWKCTIQYMTPVSGYTSSITSNGLTWCCNLLFSSKAAHCTVFTSVWVSRSYAWCGAQLLSFETCEATPLWVNSSADRSSCSPCCVTCTCSKPDAQALARSEYTILSGYNMNMFLYIMYSQ